MPRRSIAAAGTVTIDRSEPKSPKVLVVHRPRYGDWTLPKGKLDPDEYLAACAARETFEETAVRVRLESPVRSITYAINGGEKVVHWWLARPMSIGRHKPDDEIDKVAWLAPANAMRRLSYPDEHPVLEEALDLPQTTPVLVVRHAKAMLRKNWSGRDQARPLTSRGRRQSQALIPLFDAYGVVNVESSTSARCIQTVAPYARARGRDLHGWATLSEEVAEGQDRAVHRLIERFLTHGLSADEPTLICGHRPVLPTMLDALGIAGRPMQPAATVVAHFTRDGRLLAADWQRPRL